MKIHFLGTRGNIPASTPYHSKHSGILVEDVLFDVGEEEFLKYNPKAICITHLHPDHAFFVKDRDGNPPGMPVYAPEEAEGVEKLNESKKIAGLMVHPIPAIHSKYVESNAYIIEKKQKRILYTGDMIWINKEYHERLEGLDLVITDGSYMRKGGMIRRDREGNIYGHQGIPNLVNLFKKFTDHIILTHFGSWFYKDMKEARKRLRSFGIRVEAAYDGMKTEV